GNSPAGCRAHGQDIRLASYQLECDVTRQAQHRLELPELRRDGARAVQIHREGTVPLRGFRPPRLQRDVPPVELPAQALAQLTLEPAQIGGKLGGQVEV